jgi:hypothetical protein
MTKRDDAAPAKKDKAAKLGVKKQTVKDLNPKPGKAANVRGGAKPRDASPTGPSISCYVDCATEVC